MDNTINYIQVELITPKEVVANQEQYSVIIPAESGDVGILHNHTPMIFLLYPGIIRFLDEKENIVISYIIDKGFCEVKDDKCIILVNNYHDPKEISEDFINKEINETKELLSRAQMDHSGDMDFTIQFYQRKLIVYHSVISNIVI